MLDHLPLTEDEDPYIVVCHLRKNRELLNDEEDSAVLGRMFDHNIRGASKYLKIGPHGALVYQEENKE